jgi:hypothetical protein
MTRTRAGPGRRSVSATSRPIRIGRSLRDHGRLGAPTDQHPTPHGTSRTPRGRSESSTSATPRPACARSDRATELFPDPELPLITTSVVNPGELHPLHDRSSCCSEVNGGHDAPGAAVSGLGEPVDAWRESARRAMPDPERRHPHRQRPERRTPTNPTTPRWAVPRTPTDLPVSAPDSLYRIQY